MISPSLARAARASSHAAFFHAAQVKLGGAVLATASNERGRTPDDYGAWHAEERAIEQATRRGQDIRGAVVVSIRVTRSGKFANAKPCDRCMSVLRLSGVKKVVYSSPGGELITERIK